ncbi:hypothetical protein GQ457_07G039300 [Hibiscus cannabinus]
MQLEENLKHMYHVEQTRPCSLLPFLGHNDEMVAWDGMGQPDRQAQIMFDQAELNRLRLRLKHVFQLAVEGVYKRSKFSVSSTDETQTITSK